MSATQNVPSPRGPRGKQQRSNSGGQPLPSNNNGPKNQRRQKGNRAHSGYSQTAQNTGVGLIDSAVLSSEEVAIPTGPRNVKKHTYAQPAAERLASYGGVANSSLTDTDVGLSYHQATPAKAQAAYAGPTFHASPAPSSLPIPKFLSKSVPAKTRTGPPTPPLDEDGSDSGSSPTPSPSRAPVQIPLRHQDSPLDMLFKADKAERSRNYNVCPGLAVFSSPTRVPGYDRPQIMKHNSHNTQFPIELDGDSRPSYEMPVFMPPVALPAVHRSVTAPSNLPQAQSTAPPNDKSGAISDLLLRLSMSQKSSVDSTPPKNANHIPSAPSLPTHASPFNDAGSPFHSPSGPTTPAPAPQANPDFFYGNRNLSPMFKAASKKPEDSPRNSGLRTEITANSPMLPQGNFSPIPPVNFDMNGMPPRAGVGNALNNPDNSRRGSAPHIQPTQPYRGSPNQHNRRGSGRQSYQPRPGSIPYANANRPTKNVSNERPVSSPKASNMMAFVPSSVRAKPKPAATSSKVAPPPPNNLILEQDLKRMLNLG